MIVRRISYSTSWVMNRPSIYRTCFVCTKPGGVNLPEELPWNERYCCPNMIWKDVDKNTNH